MERLARKEDIQGSKKRIPMGRFGTVREIADATVYLFSEAAGYISGTVTVGTCIFRYLRNKASCFSVWHVLFPFSRDLTCPLITAYDSAVFLFPGCLLAWILYWIQ